MVKVELRGIHKLTTKGRTYYYAWRGGPRLRGEPGSPEFMASYNEAIESRRTPDTGRFKSLVVLYKASTDYKKLAEFDAQAVVALARSHRGLFRGASHCAIRPTGKDQADHSPVAQSMGRQAAHCRLRNASSFPRAFLCSRPSRQDRGQSMRGDQATLQWRPFGNHLDGRRYCRSEKDLLARNCPRG